MASAPPHRSPPSLGSDADADASSASPDVTKCVAKRLSSSLASARFGQSRSVVANGFVVIAPPSNVARQYSAATRSSGESAGDVAAVAVASPSPSPADARRASSATHRATRELNVPTPAPRAASKARAMEDNGSSRARHARRPAPSTTPPIDESDASRTSSIVAMRVVLSS